MLQRVLVAVAIFLVGLPAADAKPTAPVTVELHARAIAGGYEVTLVATPTADVPAMELEIGTTHVSTPSTKAGQPRSITERFAVGPAEGRDVVGSATVMVGGHRRNAPASIHVGVVSRLPDKRRETIRTLPNGTRITEVR